MHELTQRHGCGANGSGRDAHVRQKLARFDLTGLRVHFVGVGGCGMRGLATLFQQRGASVSGCDSGPLEDPAMFDRLQIRVCDSHSGDHVGAETNLLITSAAVPASNPDVAAARQRGVLVLKYAEALGALMSGRRGIAIAGTHGKSTTTAMCAHVLQHAGLDPSFVFGATSSQLGGNGAGGGGPHLVVEACEFDRSFLKFRPRSAVVLNVEADHFDCYTSFDDIVSAFSQFAANVQRDGMFLCNADDGWTLEAAWSARCPVSTFGFSRCSEWRAENLTLQSGGYAFDVYYRDKPFLRTVLNVPGKHNVLNALAAVALASDAGVDAAAISLGLARFSGIDRRMTCRWNDRGLTVVDDYAHHPTEIRATIEAAKSRYQPRRTWVVFQPHQYSRTVRLMDAFAGSLIDVEEVFVPSIYAAREGAETPSAAGSAQLVARIHSSGGRAQYLASLDAIAEHLASIMQDGDLVLTLGAGDVWKVADGLVERIRGSGGAPCPDRSADLVSARRHSAVPAAPARS